jgi:vacuolar-type H+-ATPase subunit E/Vma4
MTTPSETTGTGLIIEGITADARRQAETLVTEARKMAEERLSFARGRAAKITRDTEDKAQEQAAAARRTILSGIKVTLKREMLQAQDALLKEVLTRSEKKIAELSATPGYRDILVRWIAEAAAGLGAATAVVNASAHERTVIDETLLADAAALSKNEFNHTVTLSLTSAPPINGQGVVVTAADGRTAFNNQVVTRLRRHEAEIRNRVYDTMFSSTGKPGEPPEETDNA